MPTGVAASGSGLFSNVAGATTTIGSIPPGSYGGTTALFVAGVAGAGGFDLTNATTQAESHRIELTFPSGTVELTAAGSANNADRLYQTFRYQGVSDFDGGCTVGLKSMGASNFTPDFGIVGFALVSIDQDPSALAQSTPAGTTLVNFSNPNNNGGAFTFTPNPGISLIPRCATGVFVELSPAVGTPTLPTWATQTGWVDVLSVRTADGGGHGQGVVTLGLWLPPTPSSVVASPIPWEISNVTNGNDGQYLFPIMDFYRAGSAQYRAQIFG